MNKLRNTLLGGLAGILFSVAAACGGQPALPTPTPTPIQHTIQSSSEIINSVRNYKPSENEIKTAEAIKYLSSSSDRQSARNYVLQNYGENGNRAIRLVNNAETYRQQIVQNSAEGKPYTINELQSMMGTNNLLELSTLLDITFDNVYVLKVDEGEMVEFRNATKSYKEFKEATGFGAKGQPDTYPRLEAVTAYATIFLIRSIYQDPLTAHTYALAIAKDEETRKGVFMITYDIYFEGKKATQLTQEKLKEQGVTPENIKSRISEFREQKSQEAKQTIQQIQSETKGKFEEIKKESERQQEKVRQQSEELKRKAEEELRRKAKKLGDKLKNKGEN